MDQAHKPTDTFVCRNCRRTLPLRERFNEKWSVCGDDECVDQYYIGEMEARDYEAYLKGEWIDPTWRR